MPRTLTAILVLLLTLIAWGCSSSDDGGQPAAALLASDFQVTSPNFSDVRPKKRIPIQNTCYGENLSPPLLWSGAPEGTQSYALISEDIDHQTGTWVHWVMYNIPASVTEVAEGISTSTAVLPDGTTQGTNDERLPGYAGACPPANLINYTRGGGPYEEPALAHRYYFTLYALDSELGLAAGATKDELLSAMEGHILAQADTIGKYVPAVGLKDKGGAGLHDTTAATEGNLTQTPGQIPTPGGEKIYNSLGVLITPTPAGGQ